MLKAFVITAFVTATLLACQKPIDEISDGSEISSIINDRSKPLPISGTWNWVHFQGVNTEKTFKKWNLEKARAPKLLFGLDSDGVGAITSSRTCTPTDPKIGSGLVPEIAPGSPTTRGAAVINVLGNIAELFGTICDPASPGTDTKTVLQAPMLWGARSEFDDTWGTAHSEGKFSGKAAADNECHKLRGWRFVSIDKNIACIGYVDRTATKLRMLVNSSPTLVVQRLELVR